MKKLQSTLLVLSAVLQCSAWAEWDDEDRRVEAEQVAFWEKKLLEVEQESASSILGEMWLGLRNMGHRRELDGHALSVDEVYAKIQGKMLSIPGHARYFANTVEGLRAKVKTQPSAYQDTYEYDFHRHLYIAEALEHLPSPETIWVLGNFLSDERDVSPDPTFIPENAHLAAYALSNIGLRDCPFEGVKEPYRLTCFPERPQLPVFRAWWDEVREGRRAFSFNGQSVEHRFKPDGTWATIAIANPPDDGPKPPAVNADGQSDPKPVQASPPERPERSGLWVWILIGMIGGLAGVFWIGLRKSG